MIQSLLLYNVNHVVLMLTSIFQAKFPLEKGGGLYQKQGQPQPHVPSKARTPSPQL